MSDYSEFISYDEYGDYIVQSAQEYSSSFHTFYQHYIQYRFTLNKDLSTLYESFNLSKISVNWEIKTQLTNYMEEVENIVHLTTMSTVSDSLDAINYDSKNFFDSNYEKLEKNERRIQT